jgi:hypothetical protein
MQDSPLFLLFVLCLGQYEVNFTLHAAVLVVSALLRPIMNGIVKEYKRLIRVLVC